MGISSVIPVIQCVRISLNKLLPLTATGKAFMETARAAMADRLRPNFEMNMNCATATVMDPRFKFHSLTETSILGSVNGAIKQKLELWRPVVEPKGPDDSLWDLVFTAYEMEMSERDPILEFDQYNYDQKIPRKECPLKYWNMNYTSPMYKIAMESLLPRASSVPAESVASRINDLVWKLKGRVTDEYLSERIFMQSLPSDIFDSAPIDLYKGKDLSKGKDDDLSDYSF